MGGNRRTFQIFDGSGMKASLLWDEETDAWTYYSNAPGTIATGLYRTIPTVYQGINIISNEVQNVPFTVYQGEKEVDNTDDWQNTVGFLPNPRRTFGLISQALDRYGQAYMLKQQNRARIVKELKWMANRTIEPIFDERSGELLRFNRMVGTQTYAIAPADMLHFWLMDSDVEDAPPKSYPMLAALQAAGVLHSLDSYINIYFERGAIRPTIVTAKGMPSTEERARLETWFNRLMGGIRRAFTWKVFNSETVEFQQIGDGLDQLQNQTLTADQRQDVALALGIPQTILFANSANYATSQSDMLNFYNMTVVPRCEFIAEVLNDQILTPMGYHIEASPESLDVYKEDENERSQSLGSLTSAGVPLLMAMDLLGYDLTDEQRAELEKVEKEKKEQEEQMAAQLAAGPQEGGEQEEKEKPAPFQAKAIDMTPEAEAEAKYFRRLCNRALMKGKPLPLDFAFQHIPADKVARIIEALKMATDGEMVRAAFEQPEAIPLPEDWPVSPDLVLELKRANDLLESVTK